MDSPIEPIKAEKFAARHAFFARTGGVTPGHLGSLNCGSKFDAAENIRENQRRAMEIFSLPFPALTVLRQTHSTQVHIVTDEALPRQLEGDGLATRTPGMAIGVLTADCTPVLFYDAENKVIGACHAGWRGAFDGITEATIAAMETLGASRRTITAAIGPCIRQPSYEVGAEFHAQFVAQSANNDTYFIPSQKAGHFMFDMPRYVADRLTQAGIQTVCDTGLDTYSNAARFFSYRRSCHLQEEGFGNGLSAIVL